MRSAEGVVWKRRLKRRLKYDRSPKPASTAIAVTDQEA